MKKINIDTLPDNLQNLISKIETLTNATINIETDTETTTDYLDLSQSEHSENGDVITITISNSPDVNYMIAHELFHIKLDHSDFTKMSVQLFGNDADFNQQSQITASSLKGVVDHRMIAEWERTAGFRTADIQTSLNEGTQEMLRAEGANADDGQLVLYRTLVMLDNFVDVKSFEQYDQPFRIAGKLDAIIQDVTNKEQHYSALVRLFNEFDENIKIIGYIDLMHTQLITLTPIFSERQLRLSVNQVLEILHSEFVLKNNVHPYVLEMKNNHQNSGAIEIPNSDQRPEFFQGLYSMTLQDFLNDYKIDYIVR